MINEMNWGEDKKIKIAKYGEREAWLSIETAEGSTCSRPYDTMSLQELIQLRQKIDDIVRVLTKDI